MNDNEMATIEDLAAAVDYGRQKGARMIDGVPLEILAQLLDLLSAADKASGMLQLGRAAAARRLLNQALNPLDSLRNTSPLKECRP